MNNEIGDTEISDQISEAQREIQRLTTRKLTDEDGNPLLDDFGNPKLEGNGAPNAELILRTNVKPLAFQAERDIVESRQSTISSVTPAVLVSLIHEHRDEILEEEKKRAETLRIVGKFKGIRGRLYDLESQISTLRDQIQYFDKADISLAIADQILLGKMLRQVALEPEIITAIVIKQFGPGVLKYFEDRHAGIKKEYSECIKANEPILKEFGLI